MPNFTTSEYSLVKVGLESAGGVESRFSGALSRNENYQIMLGMMDKSGETLYGHNTKTLI